MSWFGKQPRHAVLVLAMLLLAAGAQAGEEKPCLSFPRSEVVNYSGQVRRKSLFFKEADCHFGI